MLIMYISVTRLHLKGKRMLPAFIWYSIRSVIQTKKARGLIYSSYNKDDLYTYWTLSVWENKQYMSEYRNVGNHLKAMQASRKIADELEYISWEADEIPNWKECQQRLHQRFGRDEGTA